MVPFSAFGDGSSYPGELQSAVSRKSGTTGPKQPKEAIFVVSPVRSDSLTVAAGEPDSRPKICARNQTLRRESHVGLNELLSLKTEDVIGNSDSPHQALPDRRLTRDHWLTTTAP